MVLLLFKRYISELYFGRRYSGPLDLPENLDSTPRRITCELWDLEEAGFRSAAQLEIQNTSGVTVEGWDNFAGTSGNDYTFITPAKTGNVPLIPPSRFRTLLAEERAKREYEAKLYPELVQRPRIFHDRVVDLSLQYQEDMSNRHNAAAADSSYYTLTPDREVVRVPHYPLDDPSLIYNRTPSPEPATMYNRDDFEPVFFISEDQIYNRTPSPELRFPGWLLDDVCSGVNYINMFEHGYTAL